MPDCKTRRRAVQQRTLGWMNYCTRGAPKIIAKKPRFSRALSLYTAFVLRVDGQFRLLSGLH